MSSIIKSNDLTVAKQVEDQSSALIVSDMDLHRKVKNIQIDLHNIDFMGPAEIVKDLFKMPYSSTPLSFALHRMGNTLLIESLPDFDEIEIRSNSKMKNNRKTANFLKEQSLHTQSKISHLSDVISNPIFSNAFDNQNLYSYSNASTDVSDLQTGSPYLPPTNYYFTSLPVQVPFQQTLQYSMDNMKLIMGSNISVFGTEGHPTILIKPIDVTHEIEFSTCLDYYLDNVMSNVPELALCLHSKGFLRSIKMIDRNNIPNINSFLYHNHHAFPPTSTSHSATSNSDTTSNGSTNAMLFDPKVIEYNAATILKFLKENCITENATYIVHSPMDQNGKGKKKSTPTDDMNKEHDEEEDDDDESDQNGHNIIPTNADINDIDRGSGNVISNIRNKGLSSTVCKKLSMSELHTLTNKNMNTKSAIPNTHSVSSHINKRSIKSKGGNNGKAGSEDDKPSIQVFDLTQLSLEKKKQYHFMLAMVSYRFAIRLDLQLKSNSQVSILSNIAKIQLRNRKLELYENSYALLQEIHYVLNGEAHESICANILENIADIYLSKVSEYNAYMHKRSLKSGVGDTKRSMSSGSGSGNQASTITSSAAVSSASVSLSSSFSSPPPSAPSANGTARSRSDSRDLTVLNPQVAMNAKSSKPGKSANKGKDVNSNTIPTPSETGHNSNNNINMTSDDHDNDDEYDNFNVEKELDSAIDALLGATEALGSILYEELKLSKENIFHSHKNVNLTSSQRAQSGQLRKEDNSALSDTISSVSCAKERCSESQDVELYKDEDNELFEDDDDDAEEVDIVDMGDNAENSIFAYPMKHASPPLGMITVGKISFPSVSQSTNVDDNNNTNHQGKQKRKNKANKHKYSSNTNGKVPISDTNKFDLQDSTSNSFIAQYIDINTSSQTIKQLRNSLRVSEIHISLILQYTGILYKLITTINTLVNKYLHSDYNANNKVVNIFYKLYILIEPIEKWIQIMEYIKNQLISVYYYNFNMNNSHLHQSKYDAYDAEGANQRWSQLKEVYYDIWSMDDSILACLPALCVTLCDICHYISKSCFLPSLPLGVTSTSSASTMSSSTMSSASTPMPTFNCKGVNSGESKSGGADGRNDGNMKESHLTAMDDIIARNILLQPIENRNNHISRIKQIKSKSQGHDSSLKTKGDASKPNGNNNDNNNNNLEGSAKKHHKSTLQKDNGYSSGKVAGKEDNGWSDVGATSDHSELTNNDVLNIYIRIVTYVTTLCSTSHGLSKHDKVLFQTHLLHRDSASHMSDCHEQEATSDRDNLSDKDESNFIPLVWVFLCGYVDPTLHDKRDVLDSYITMTHSRLQSDSSSSSSSSCLSIIYSLFSTITKDIFRKERRPEYTYDDIECGKRDTVILKEHKRLPQRIMEIQTIFLICKLLLAARDQSQWGRIHWYKLPSEIPQIYTNTNVKVKSNLNGAAKIHHSNQYDQYIPEHTPICVVSLICKVDGDKSVGAGVGGALSGTATDDVYQSLRKLADTANDIGQILCNTLKHDSLTLTIPVIENNEGELIFTRVYKLISNSILNRANSIMSYYQSAIQLFSFVHDDLNNSQVLCNQSSLYRLLTNHIMKSLYHLYSQSNVVNDVSCTLNSLLCNYYEEKIQKKTTVDHIFGGKNTNVLSNGNTNNNKNLKRNTHSNNKSNNNSNSIEGGANSMSIDSNVHIEICSPLHYIESGLSVCKRGHDILQSRVVGKTLVAWDRISSEVGNNFFILGHLHRLCATDPKISSDAKKNNIVDTNKQSLEHAVLSDNRMAAHIAAASQSFEQALRIFKEVENDRHIALAHFQLGSLYSWSCNADKSQDVVRIEKAFLHHKEAHDYFLKYDVGPTFLSIILDMTTLYIQGYVTSSQESGFTSNKLQSMDDKSDSAKDLMDYENVCSLLGGAFQITMECKFTLTNAVLDKYREVIYNLLTQLIIQFSTLLKHTMKFLINYKKHRNSLITSLSIFTDVELSACIQVVKDSYLQLMKDWPIVKAGGGSAHSFIGRSGEEVFGDSYNAWTGNGNCGNGNGNGSININIGNISGNNIRVASSKESNVYSNSDSISTSINVTSASTDVPSGNVYNHGASHERCVRLSDILDKLNKSNILMTLFLSDGKSS